VSLGGAQTQSTPQSARRQAMLASRIRVGVTLSSLGFKFAMPGVLSESNLKSLRATAPGPPAAVTFTVEDSDNHGASGFTAGHPAATGSERVPAAPPTAGGAASYSASRRMRLGAGHAESPMA
jgi:hypothetical protein